MSIESSLFPELLMTNLELWKQLCIVKVDTHDSRNDVYALVDKYYRCCISN